MELISRVLPGILWVICAKALDSLAHLFLPFGESLRNRVDEIVWLHAIGGEDSLNPNERGGLVHVFKALGRHDECREVILLLHNLQNILINGNKLYFAGRLQLNDRRMVKG